MAKKYFGTDGVRGEVGQFPINPDFVLKLGYTAGQVLMQHEGEIKPTVLIGKDTRTSGYMLEAALIVSSTAVGVNVIQTGPPPTPGVAHLTRALRLSAGVMTSASHNVYSDNGIKFFAEDGVKLSDEIELEIEARIDEEMKTQPSSRLGRVCRINGADDRYIESCKPTFPSHLDLCGLKLAVDTANGADYAVAPKVFHELGAQVVSIGNEPNGYNINEKCGAARPKALQAAVLQNEADHGIALNDDGDRLTMVDRNGKMYDGDSLIYVIAKVRAHESMEIGGVVGTVMTGMAMGVTLKEQGVDFRRVRVDDRYVLEQLYQRGRLIGGEVSGHILCMDKHNTGDGIISVLQVLAALQTLNQDLAIVRADWQPYPQTMINVRIKRGQDWQDVSKGALAEVEKELEGKGRVVLRASGTEPVVRVTVEAKQADWVGKGAEKIAAAIQGQK